MDKLIQIQGDVLVVKHITSFNLVTIQQKHCVEIDVAAKETSFTYNFTKKEEAVELIKFLKEQFDRDINIFKLIKKEDGNG